MLGMLIEHELQYPKLQPKGVLWSVYGRSAPLFVLLAGVGLTLASGDRARHRRRAMILTRAPLLLLVGMALSLGGDGVILQSFALFFVVGVCVIRLPRWALAIAAGTCLVGGPLFLTLLRRHGELTFFGSQTDVGFRALLDPVRLARGLTLSYYPAVIWLGFFFVGMLLGRLNLSSAAAGRRLFGWSAITAVSLFTIGWACARAFAPAIGSFGVAPDPPTMWSQHWTTYGFSNSVGWALSSTAVALAIVGGCVWMTARVRGQVRVLAPLAALGAMPLTFYVLHFAYLGTAWSQLVLYLTNPISLLCMSLVFWFAFAAMAQWWLTRFRRGPLESVLHTVAFTVTAPTRTGAGVESD